MLLFDFLIKVPLCECVCDSGCYQCHGRLQMLMGGGKRVGGRRGGVQRLRENTGHSDVTGPLKRLEKDSDAPPACFYGDSLR